MSRALVFDQIAFEAACLHNAQIIDAVVAAYRADRWAREHALSEAVASADVERIKQSAHKLEGALGTLRAQAAYEATGALLCAAESGRTETLVHLFERVRGELLRLDQALSA